jgi:hypothetical protein
MKFVIKSTSRHLDPYLLKKSTKDKWEDVVTSFNKNASYGVNKVLQTAGEEWCLLVT